MLKVIILCLINCINLIWNRTDMLQYLPSSNLTMTHYHTRTYIIFVRVDSIPVIERSLQILDKTFQ